MIPTTKSYVKPGCAASTFERAARRVCEAATSRLSSCNSVSFTITTYVTNFQKLTYEQTPTFLYVQGFCTVYAKCLQNPSQMKVDNMDNVRCEPGRTFWTKERVYLKEKINGLNQKVKIKILKTCTEALIDLRRVTNLQSHDMI
jgi:hypothetical protein